MSTRGAPRGRGVYRGRGSSSARGRGGTYKFGVWRASDDSTLITHPAYADQDGSGADLVIQTTDEVLFKVHSCYLKAASTFFRSMPDQKDFPASPETDATIHVDADADAFKIVLDLVTDAQPSNGKVFGWSYHDLIRALSVGERLGFTHLPRKAMPYMYKHATDSYAWAVFTFAAKNDFPMLAAHAIDNLQSPQAFSTTDILNFDFAIFDDIPGAYVGPLVRNMTMFRNENGRTDWRKVSHNFPELEEHRVRHPTYPAAIVSQ